MYPVSAVGFDLMEYLHDFDYGQVSKLSDGATVREFTIITEDEKIMDISPDVFYNVWTFNGSILSPTLEWIP